MQNNIQISQKLFGIKFCGLDETKSDLFGNNRKINTWRETGEATFCLSSRFARLFSSNNTVKSILKIVFFLYRSLADDGFRRWFRDNLSDVLQIVPNFVAVGRSPAKLMVLTSYGQTRQQR